jgi:hypothetical protein
MNGQNFGYSCCQIHSCQACLPLHLLCARHWDQDSLSLSLIRTMIRHHMGAVRQQERQGRLPLHLACEQGHPRRDIVELIVESFPAGLLYAETQSGRTPLATYELMKGSGSRRENETIRKVLCVRTNREKSKNGFMRKLFRTRR